MPHLQTAARNYLVYWRPKSVDVRFSRHPLLDYASSSQFCHVNDGDVLWFVTVRNGKLFLVGKLTVGEQTARKGAEHVLGNQVGGIGRFLVAAKPGTAAYMREIPLEDIAEQIRFESSTNDRFTILNGVLNPQQMQMKRRLSNSASQLINAKWNSESTISSAPKSQDI